MNNLHKVVLSVAVVLAISGAYLYPQVKQELGATPGPEVLTRYFFNEGMTSGGRVATTTTVSTYTTSARDFGGTPTYIDWLPNVNTTISLSATSTHQYVPKVGDVAKIYFRNASTTAAASITFAASDANLDLQDNEDSADLALLGLDWMEITLVRESDYLVSALLQEYTEAD